MDNSKAKVKKIRCNYNKEKKNEKHKSKTAVHIQNQKKKDKAKSTRTTDGVFKTSIDVNEPCRFDGKASLIWQAIIQLELNPVSSRDVFSKIFA